jgi:NSS family neurotransmitter:Na+ symporter
VPLMFAEFAIGRRGRRDAAGSIAAVASAHGAARRWALVGALGVTTGFLILSFYAVIGGWTIGYAVETAVKGIPADPRAVQERFDAFPASPLRLFAYQFAFLAVTAVIVARGVAAGIEAAAKLLMPILAALMLALAAYAAIEGDLAAALRFLLRLDPQYLTARTALEALGLGFFSIGVGLGLMITYAAYSGSDIDLKQVALVSVAADTGISFLAGLAVFPIVFAYGLDPASGPGLVFVTLPLASMGVLVEATPYDLLDHLTSNILLLLGGLAIGLFSGWAVPDRPLIEELRLRPAGARVLRFTLRYVVPAAIAAAALSSLVFRPG